MKKTPGQMASLINSPKHKKGPIPITQTFQENGKETLSIFYDMETKPRKENKTAINMPAWQGDCSTLEAWDLRTSGMGVRVEERENGGNLEASPWSPSVKLLCEKRWQNIRSEEVRWFEGRWSYDCEIIDEWELRPQATLAALPWVLL